MREWRKFRGLDQADIASAMNTYTSVISRYERGHRGITFDVLFKVCAILDITPGQFFMPRSARLWTPSRATFLLRKLQSGRACWSGIAPSSDGKRSPRNLPRLKLTPLTRLRCVYIVARMSDEQAITPHETPVPAELQGDPVLLMIERAARDPTIDVEKFKELWALRKERQAEIAEAEFNAAFAKLLPALPVIDQKGQIKIYAKADREKPGGPTPDDKPVQVTRYVKFEDILEAVRGPLADHDFAIRFEPSTAASDNRIVMTAVLMHRAGHSARATSPPLQHDASGSKNAVQAVGSTLSYAKRYALMSVLPIVSHAPADADDDAEAAGSQFIAIDDIAFLEQQIRDTQTDKARFLAAFDAPSIAGITKTQLKRAKDLLAAKKRKAAKP
jgi:transcriptional regulator with XRE-family HTH domain